MCENCRNWMGKKCEKGDIILIWTPPFISTHIVFNNTYYARCSIFIREKKNNLRNVEKWISIYFYIRNLLLTSQRVSQCNTHKTFIYAGRFKTNQTRCFPPKNSSYHLWEIFRVSYSIHAWYSNFTIIPKKLGKCEHFEKKKKILSMKPCLNWQKVHFFMS